MKSGDILSIRGDDGKTTRGEFVSQKSGWVQYYDRDGKIRKTRSGQVKLAPESTENGAVNMTTQEATTVNNEAGAAPAAVVANATKSTVENLKEARSHYHKEKIGSGKESRILVDCDDDIAKMLRGMDLAQTYDLAAEKTGKTVDEFKAKYAHLNNGMQRMNLGNIIRGALRPKVDNSEKEAARAAKAQAKLDAKAKAEQEKADKKAAADQLKAQAKADRDAALAVKKQEREEKAAAAKAAKAAAKSAATEPKPE